MKLHLLLPAVLLLTTASSFQASEPAPLRIGWAETDITPEKLPALIAGQLFARLSEGVADPLKATACAMESDGEQAVFVGCDLVNIEEGIKDLTRERLAQLAPDLDPKKVILNATHTHQGALCNPPNWFKGATSPSHSGIDLGEGSSEEYRAFVADRLAECVARAWKGRAPGAVAFGLGSAVVGRNRRWVDHQGVSYMYKLKPDQLSHIEGYEDHSLNLLAVYDAKGGLTGLIVNLPGPAQAQENTYQLSADFWFETRRELRKRFGENLFILPQVSAAGDQHPSAPYEKAAEARMLKLRGLTNREAIAQTIADAVGTILPHLGPTADSTPVFKHTVEMVDLPLNLITQADADEAAENAKAFQAQYESELQKLEADPALRKTPRWYVPVTRAYRKMGWHLGVVDRFERQKTKSSELREVHAIRLGDVAFASNPFELYVDFGIQIKTQSPAIQTFLIQLAGNGTYVPSPRSVKGGGYGSVPASNVYGPEGGKALVVETTRLLNALWSPSHATDIKEAK